MASEAAWGPRSSLARTPWQPMHGSPVTARQLPVQGSVLSLGSLQACPREGTSVREVSPVYWQFCIAVNGNSDARCLFSKPAAVPRVPVWGRFQSTVCSSRESALVAPAAPEPEPALMELLALAHLHSPPPPGRQQGAAGWQLATWAPRGRLFQELLGASLPTPHRPLGRREGRGGSGAGCGLRSPKPSTHAGRRPAAWR